ncbi:Asp/Glu racemase [Cupriavidus sp. P-10]|uniref:aspartate/glutamate racemase family protein n=1 Tax=Cupriavidus sp. P-10 TaxID=2027911 RepID=UPI000EC09517|nr:aspartate/glutamate racemase family protein [Cupriavidus sp. P-10]BDB27272.1 Asp/Glu racemase [Cupriavidus sp. P-10]
MDVFNSAASRLDVRELSLQHFVRADLLVAAENEGGLTHAIQRDTVEALVSLSRNVDAVLLTCSTLGPAADVADEAASVPVLRVDAALAREATRLGGKVVALCAVQTSIKATRQVFNDAAARAGADVSVELVAGAWDYFKAGNIDGYLTLIAKAALAVRQASECTVALAQASMAKAADQLPRDLRPLTSPATGLLAAVRAATNGQATRCT